MCQRDQEKHPDVYITYIHPKNKNSTIYSTINICQYCYLSCKTMNLLLLRNCKKKNSGANNT